jgi:hypothetical protein
VAFPDDALGLKAQMKIDGEWVDLRLRTSDPVQTTWGTSSEGSRPEPASCTLKASNKDGALSPRNPYGPHFGKLGRNVPLRVTVPGTESYLALTGEAADIASTPDVAALDITGDLDVRIEGAYDWQSSGSTTFIGKWDSATNQRSWLLHMDTGTLWLRFSPDGANSYWAGVPVPTLPRRAALRATLDVDNGAGGWTATFYSASTLDGPWTQIGDPVTVASATSLFASTAPLSIAPSSFTVTPAWLPAPGRAWRAEVRSGIGGTVVANPDFRAVPVGATSFTDAAGRTWTLSGAAEITTREYLFTGEVSDLPSEWTISGMDAWVSLEASGLLRRLGQGRKALQSTLRRRIPSAAGLLAYWPMEEGDTATQAYSPLAGVQPLAANLVDFAADDSLGGSAPLPALKAGGSVTGVIPATSATGWHAEMVYHLPTMPGVQTEIMRMTVTRSTMRYAVVTASTAGVRVEAQDSQGETLAGFTFTDPTAVAAFSGKWSRLQLFTSDEGGGQTRLVAAWLDVATSSWWLAATVFTGTMGAPVKATVLGPEGLAFGHLSVFPIAGTGNNPNVTAYQGADDGFQGETALVRIDRLNREEPTLALSWIDGDVSLGSTRMGPQGQDELLNLLGEIVDTDGGILYERMDRLGLVYRDRSTLYNQAPALTLDYATGDIAAPFRPVEDDQHIRNDIQVTRRGGSSARVVVSTGPLSALTPEEGGVGVYDEAVTLSLHDDTQPIQHAAWRAHLGTWDEPQYPTVRVLLHKRPSLIPAVLGLRIGDLLRINNPPVWAGPGPVDLLIRQIQHTPLPRTWEVTFVGTPAGPYRVGVVGDPVLGRADTAGSSLSAAASQSATQLEVQTDSGPRWINSVDHASMFPFDVVAGGERMTVSAITNRADTFGRSVSNGWGTSSSGVAWAESGGAAADRSVNGARGVITLNPSVSTVRFQRLVTTPVADCEVLVRMSASAVATGASAVPAVLLRYVDTSNFYRARLHFGTGGGMFVSISRDTTQIGSSPALPYTYTAGQEFEVRVRLVGHTIQMRVWPVGQAEPAVWHHTETVVTNPIVAGGIGVTGSSFAGLTNVGLQLLFDSFEVVTPQLFTVVRSVNGITKAHAASTSLALQTPMRAAL